MTEVGALCTCPIDPLGAKRHGPRCGVPLTLDELPFTFDDGRIPNGAKGRPTCKRHDWVRQTDGLLLTTPDQCARCGTIRDLVRADTGRRAAKRGKAIQRKRIEGLGGMNLAGNNPNLDGIGSAFAYESKSGTAFPERPWRWLKDIPVRADQTQVLIITDAPGRGHKARCMVIVDYDDWRKLHGE